MSCERMEARILPYVDGRLKNGERAEVEKHLAGCAACRLRVNEFRAVNELLGELPQIEPSAAFDVRVHARVAAEPAKRSWWAWFAPSPRVAFAASMLLVATVWLGTHRVGPTNTANNAQPDDSTLIQDAPVLENMDVLSSFEPLTDLPEQPTQATPAPDDDDQQM